MNKICLKCVVYIFIQVFECVCVLTHAALPPQYQYEIFGQAWQMLKRLVQHTSQAAMTPSTQEGEPAPSSSSSSPDNNPEGGSTTDQGEGVPIVIHQEGGYSAAIVSLLATKRIVFNIVIPEQIIMMDQHYTIMQDHHKSLLQRFSDHTQLSGREIQDFDITLTDPEKRPRYLAGISRPKVGDRIAEAMGREPFPLSLPTQDSESQEVKTGICGSVKRKAGKGGGRVKKLCKAPSTMSHEKDKDKDEEEGKEVECNKNPRLPSTPSQPKVEKVKETQDSVEADDTEEPSQGEGKKKEKRVSFQDGDAGDAVEMQDAEDTSVQGEASYVEEDAEGSESQVKMCVQVGSVALSSHLYTCRFTPPLQMAQS